jgi:5'-nucleotidase
MEMPVALFDMDGTLCDYEGQLKKDMELLMSPGEEYEDIFDESKPWLKARTDLIKSQPGWWSNLPVIDNGIVLFEQIVAGGFDVEILTKGPRKNRAAWKEKGEWIDRHIGIETPINIVGNDKARYYGHVLVEDYPEFLLGWLKHRPRGLGILMHNERNKGFEHPNVIRYRSYFQDMQQVKLALWAVKHRKPEQHWRDVI